MGKTYYKKVIRFSTRCTDTGTDTRTDTGTGLRYGFGNGTLSISRGEIWYTENGVGTVPKWYPAHP